MYMSFKSLKLYTKTLWKALKLNKQTPFNNPSQYRSTGIQTFPYLLIVYLFTVLLFSVSTLFENVYGKSN